MEVNNSVANRVKTTRKRLGEEKMAKHKSTKWRADLTKERLFISDDSSKAKTNSPEVVVLEKPMVINNSNARSNAEDDTRHEKLKRKLAEIRSSTRNIYIRRGRAIMDKKEVEPETQEQGNNLAVMVVPEPTSVNVEEEVQHDDEHHEEEQGETMMIEEYMTSLHQMENDTDRGTEHEGETDSDTLAEVETDTGTETKEVAEVQRDGNAVDAREWSWKQVKTMFDNIIT